MKKPVGISGRIVKSHLNEKGHRVIDEFELESTSVTYSPAPSCPNCGEHTLERSTLGETCSTCNYHIEF